MSIRRVSWHSGIGDPIVSDMSTNEITLPCTFCGGTGRDPLCGVPTGHDKDGNLVFESNWACRKCGGRRPGEPEVVTVTSKGFGGRR